LFKKYIHTLLKKYINIYILYLKCLPWIIQCSVQIISYAKIFMSRGCIFMWLGVIPSVTWILRWPMWTLCCQNLDEWMSVERVYQIFVLNVPYCSEIKYKLLQEALRTRGGHPSKPRSICTNRFKRGEVYRPRSISNRTNTCFQRGVYQMSIIITEISALPITYFI